MTARPTRPTRQTGAFLFAARRQFASTCWACWRNAKRAPPAPERRPDRRDRQQANFVAPDDERVESCAINPSQQAD